jgi:hypothetical protein
MASTLNPPMSDLDLLSALTSHFEPRVQQGLICTNLQSTQDALAFLAKLQGLADQRQNFRSPRPELDLRDTNRGPPRDQDNARNRERGNGVKCGVSGKATDTVGGIQTEHNGVKADAAFIDVARGARGKIAMAS